MGRAKTSTVGTTGTRTTEVSPKTSFESKEHKNIFDSANTSEIDFYLRKYKSVVLLENGIYRVTFNDGSIVMVDLNKPSVVTDGNDTPALSAAALALAQAQNSRFDSSASEDVKILGDLLKEMDALGDDLNAEMSLALAEQATRVFESNEYIEDEDEQLKDLLNKFRKESNLPPLTQSTIDRRIEENFQEYAKKTLDRVRDANNPSNVSDIQALIFGAKPDGTVDLPNEVKANMALAAANEEEHLIPTSGIKFETREVIGEDGVARTEEVSVGDYYYGPQERRETERFTRYIFQGPKNLANLSGPAGSGKGELIKEQCAAWGLRYIQINAGGEDWVAEDAIGAEGIAPKVMMVDGTPTAMAVTTTTEGMVTRYIKQGGVLINFDEIEKPNEMTPFHSLAGDDIRGPNPDKPMQGRRTVTISGPSGTTVESEPSVVLTTTHNTGKADFHPAWKDRGIQIRMTAPEPDVEAERIKLMNKEFFRCNEILDPADLNFSPEVMLPVVEVANRMREKARNDEDTWDEIGSRSVALLGYELLHQGYNSNNDDESILNGFVYEMEGWAKESAEMFPEDVQSEISQAMDDKRDELINIINIGRKIRNDDIDKGAAEAK